MPTRRMFVLRAARVSLIMAAVILGFLVPGRPASPAHGAAQATDDLMYGMQLHPLWGSEADFDRELDLALRLGARSVRMDIDWSRLEKSGKGEYDDRYVAKADRFLEHAQQRGLQVLATLLLTPCWAAAAPADIRQDCQGDWWNRFVQRYPPAHPSDFADAAAWVAGRWGSRLAALELGNEPNEPKFLAAADPAPAYAALLQAAYPAVKAVAPELIVVGGVLSTANGDFLERLYASGIRGSFDALAVHPYTRGRDPAEPATGTGRRRSFVSGVPWIHDIMTNHGDGDKALWLTEFGFTTCTGQETAGCVSETRQGEYLGRAIDLARAWPFVRAMFVYTLRDISAGRIDQAGGYGLVDRDFGPRPSYFAVRDEFAAAARSATSRGAESVGDLARVP